MARVNKIYIGPVDDVKPQAKERLASVALLPGRLVVQSAGKFALAAAATKGTMYVVQDNYLAMKGVDDVWAVDDTAIGLDILDGQIYAVRVPTGVNVADDAPLSPGANGEVVLATTGAMVVFVADEAYNNTSGASQLVRVRAVKGYIAP